MTPLASRPVEIPAGVWLADDSTSLRSWLRCSAIVWLRS